ncbi:MAG: hypothetical protein HC771_12240 [Synechococcales cyanobacterium CRU_2_2]|nr:hypothetical protein [Synechococcales cyanobacterium CRU_2_2]
MRDRRPGSVIDRRQVNRLPVPLLSQIFLIDRILRLKLGKSPIFIPENRTYPKAMGHLVAKSGIVPANQAVNLSAALTFGEFDRRSEKIRRDRASLYAFPKEAILETRNFCALPPPPPPWGIATSLTGAVLLVCSRFSYKAVSGWVVQAFAVESSEIFDSIVVLHPVRCFFFGPSFSLPRRQALESEIGGLI